jgi:LPXTG-motif cell wall-anchored protein
MPKQLQSLLTMLLLAWSTMAFAQTAPETPAAPGTTSTGTATGTELDWLWILIAVAVVAAAVWYFTRRRRTSI